MTAKEGILSRYGHLARAAAAAVSVLLLASCAWASPNRTSDAYAPADGVRVALDEDGAVRVENLMILAAGDAQLAGALVNDTAKPVTVGVEVAGQQARIQVEPSSVVLLEEGTGPFAGAGEPGTTMKVTFTHQGVTTWSVPVLEASRYLP